MLEVQTWRFCGCEIVTLIDLMNLEALESTWLNLLLGESASPFIDEGDGLTNERERVHMLLRLVAHAGGYWIMVGAHNTIGCWMHVGGYVILFGHGRRWRLPHC